MKGKTQLKENDYLVLKEIEKITRKEFEELSFEEFNKYRQSIGGRELSYYLNTDGELEGILIKIPIKQLVCNILPRLSIKNLSIQWNPEINYSFLKELKGLTYLDLSDNPIKNIPPEVLRGGSDAILNFIRETDFEEFLYEAKMVMVGRGSVGKTVLTKKLTNPDYHLLINELITKGIDILKNPFNLSMDGLQKTLHQNLFLIFVY